MVHAMNLSIKLRILAIILIIASISLLAPLIYFQYSYKSSNSKAILAPPVNQIAAVTVHDNPSTISGKPVRLMLASVAVDVSVSEGTYDPQTGNWSIENGKAFFAPQSAQPNNSANNTLIYGHAQKNVFSSLKKLTSGAEAIIETDTGYRFYYTYASSNIVSPDDVSVFLYQGPSRLTLQTCVGAFYQNRQLFYFNFLKYEKIPQTVASSPRQ